MTLAGLTESGGRGCSGFLYIPQPLGEVAYVRLEGRCPLPTSATPFLS